MSLEAVIARVGELQQLGAPRTRTGTPAGTGATFAQQLDSAQGVPTALLGTAAGSPAGWQATGTTGLPPGMTLPGLGVPATTAPAAASSPDAAARRVAVAAGEIGVTEQPPGSNDGPRIAQYRSAMRGAPGVGPWCAYFASWVSQQAGTPLGETGQGFASVDAAYAWAQRTGRAVPNSPTAPAHPKPGDLIVWDEHIGLVESVDPNGTVHTIEGNSSNMVTRRTHDAGSALGYISM